MKRSVLAGIVVAIWLFFWATDTGVLVASWGGHDYDGRPAQVCHYVIGLSIVRKVGGVYNREGRCAFLPRV
jgi:hypothetical protein